MKIADESINKALELLDSMEIRGVQNAMKVVAIVKLLSSAQREEDEVAGASDCDAKQEKETGDGSKHC